MSSSSASADARVAPEAWRRPSVRSRNHRGIVDSHFRKSCATHARVTSTRARGIRSRRLRRRRVRQQRPVPKACAASLSPVDIPEVRRGPMALQPCWLSRKARGERRPGARPSVARRALPANVSRPESATFPFSTVSICRSACSLSPRFGQRARGSGATPPGGSCSATSASRRPTRFFSPLPRRDRSPCRPCRTASARRSPCYRQ
jgi:hypothetical protein